MSRDRTKNTTAPGRPVHVALVGQLPPPVHGQSLSIQQLVDAPWEDIVVHPVRLDMSDTLNQVGKASASKLLRLWRCARSARQVLTQHAPCLLYYPPAPARLVPFLRDALFLRAVRPAASGTVLHFHAGGVGAYAVASPLRRWLAKPYQHADVAIQLGASCPADGLALRALRVCTIPVGIADPGVRALGPVSASGAPFRVLVVGHMTPEKGIGLLPEIAARLEGRAEFRVIGEWGSEASRRDMEPRLQGPNIRLLGGCYGAAKWKHFETADAFLFPSFNETQGLVAVEAMACGLPVVASRIDGLRDVVDDGRTGSLVQVGNAATFAAAIEALMQSPQQWQTMSKAARERFASTFSLDAYLRSMRAVFHSCAGEDRGTGTC